MAEEQHLRQMAEQLARIVEVSITLNSTLNLDELLQFITKTAAEILDCEAVSILLYDEKRAQLNFVASTGSDAQRLATIPVPLENSLAGQIFLDNTPMIISDMKSQKRHYSQVALQVGIEVHNLLGVPMRIKNRPTGVMEALNKRYGSFTEEDVDLLSILASQAAVAIHNARLVQALRQAYNELSATNQLKSNFLALASHELRTPLGIIIGYASFLEQESQGELSEHAKQVLNAAMQMRAVIDAMTNLNMLHSKEMVMHRVAVPIQNILHNALASIQKLADAKGHQVILNIPKTPLSIKCDPDKLTTAFVNILDNAVRFTPDGGTITITASLTPGGDMLVSISDTGIGIAPSHLKKIFDEFYQVEPHTTRKHGGLGIGLPIAKGLIEAHGGKIWAESEGPGKGSTFKILLPKLSTAALSAMSR
ncbi:MAG: GAF domain-containing sensor histidine kinase [Anaerolineales bacterium]|nr:GAF domain-containing sensor histidine kinase [Anaerolineales bacterium]MCX7609633.1 GAF domain-containing sensor histidine kinase [Anaerolineales bacterium]MDW8227222.1 GAF domain-containing sensor histidine kinase [Anaerolineales bacterium]